MSNSIDTAPLTLGTSAAPLELWQRAAVALDEYACGGDKGRDKRDPVYQEVCEGRDNPATYSRMSTCADRAHWRLWRFGVRAPFVNRESRTPLPGDWHVGANISELWNHAHGSPARAPDEHWLPEPGDELLIWNTGFDAHSLSVLSYDPIAHTARTANYGTAGMSKATFPGARCSVGPVVHTAAGWMYGKRKVQRVLKLADIVALITAKPDFKDSSGAYIFGDGETLDALESIVP